MSDKIYPHGSLRQLVGGVWIVRGISPFPLHRNMIVVRRPDGALVLHSVVALDEEGMRALRALGEPTLAIVPNVGHQRDAPFYHRQFPNLRVVAPAGARARIEPNVPIAATVEEALPPLGWTLHKVPGFKIDEYVYEVPLAGGGRMLIVNDIFGNANAAENSPLGWLMKAGALGLGQRFGIPRVVRWRMITDLSAVKRFADVLAAIPDVRLLTVSHGDPVTDDPASRLRAAAA